VVVVVPEIIIDGHLYEMLSLSSVKVSATICFSVTHTATYNRPATTDHVFNMMTFQCHSEKTE